MPAETTPSKTALSNLEIKQIDARVERLLLEFFISLKANHDDTYFHPHEFDAETARRIANHRGQDLYYLMCTDVVAVGYGMLRGWDEGYAIPSLGIAIHPAYRSQGLSKVLMVFLHAAAQIKGAKKVRLKVNPKNKPALRLYQQLGYVFSSDLEKGELVGYITLPE